MITGIVLLPKAAELRPQMWIIDRSEKTPGLAVTIRPPPPQGVITPFSLPPGRDLGGRTAEVPTIGELCPVRIG